MRKNSSFFLVLLIALLLVPRTWAYAMEHQQPTAITLNGNINGNLPFVMRLNFDGPRVTGTYYYTRYLEELSLVGVVDKHMRMVFYEFDSEGEHTGTFEGKMSEGTFTGIWSDPDQNRSYPFEAQREHSAHREGEREQCIVADDDTWRRSVRFPGTVTISNVTTDGFDLEIVIETGAILSKASGNALIKKTEVKLYDEEWKATFSVRLESDVDVMNSSPCGGIGAFLIGNHLQGVKERGP